MGGVLDAIANYDPSGFIQEHQQRQANLTQTGANTALTQQQTTAAAQENQLRQRTLQDQDAIMRAWRNVDPTADIATQQQQVLTGAIRNGATPTGITQVQQHFADLRAKNATATAEELKNEATRHDDLAGVLSTIRATPDPAQKQALWSQYAPRIQADLGPGEPPPPQQYPGDDAAQTLANIHQYQSALTGQEAKAAELGKTKAETQAQLATAGKSKAETEREQLQTQVEQHQLDLYNTLKGSPQALQARIAQSVDPQKYPQEYQAAVSEAQMAPDLKGINAVVDKHGQNIREREKTVATETDPNVLAARRKQSEAQALYQNALSQGDTARAKYYESLSDMQQSLGTAETIQRVLDLSKQGNAVAGSQLKAMVPEFTNAVQNIKRMAASQGDKGLASRADQLSSEASSLLEGKPLSDSVMAQIGPYINEIKAGAAVQHNNTVKALNKAYPQSNFHPESVPGKINVRASDGNIHPFDSEALAKAFELAVKARGGTTSRQ